MSDQSVEVRAIVWKELFPWLLLPRAFSIAISPAVLLSALLALVVSSAGWQVLSIFVVKKDSNGDYVMREGIDQTSLVEVRYLAAWPSKLKPPTGVLQRRPVVSHIGGASTSEDPVFSVAYRYALPWMKIFRQPSGELGEAGRTWREFAFYFGGGLWSLLSWSLFAGAITRTAALRMGREERIGLRGALSFSGRRVAQYFSAPLLPLLGVLLLAILPAIAGLLMRLSFFAAIGGVFWFVIILAFGLPITLLILGLIVSWPLMWPAISAEGRNGDSFDALSRSYGYAFGRPLNYLFYALVAAVIGMLGWLLVVGVSELVITMSYWSVSLGTGSAQMSQIRDAAAGDSLDSGMLEWGGQAVGWWISVVRAFANAYAYSFFWCAATAIYLLLRRDVDQAEIESVEPEGDETPLPLPPLTSDVAAAAGVAGAPGSPGEGE